MQFIENFIIGTAAEQPAANLYYNRFYYATDTQIAYYSDGSAWNIIDKNINASTFSITDTSAATGDILYFNGTKFVRFARGSNTQVLQSTATTIQWATFNAENTGIAVGNGNATVYNIAHSIGGTPTVFFAKCISHAIDGVVTADGTNVTITYGSATPAGTNNIKIYWRAIA